MHNTQRARDGGSLANAILMLERANTWKNPANVFGKDMRGKSAVSLFVEDFGQGNAFNPNKQIEAELKYIVGQAAAEIQKVFPVYEEVFDGVLYTYRRTRYSSKTDDLTYFPLDETDVPWSGERPWPKLVNISVDKLEPASEEVLKAVGIVEEPARV
jgi:hypothetical protein